MKYYVLKYANGSLVGIDTDSGGYPWEAWKPSEPNRSLHYVAMYPFTEEGKQKAVDYSNGQFELAILEWNIINIDK